MSNFVQEDEDLFLNGNVFAPSSIHTPTAGALTPTSSFKKKRNLPGNPGKFNYKILVLYFFVSFQNKYISEFFVLI